MATKNMENSRILFNIKELQQFDVGNVRFK
jgi:hypothetical protein